jgi:hypothetical protein
MGIQGQDIDGETQVLVCVAHGHAQSWEALCLDFDLAVQGQSLAEVRDALEHAIIDYIDTARAESEPARSRLLNRRAPFWIRLGWAFRFFTRTISGKNRDSDSTIGFPVSCHA